MKKKFTLLFLAVMIPLLAFSSAKAVYENVVPAPQNVQAQKGSPFMLSQDVVIYYTAGDAELERDARFLSDYIYDMTKLRLQTAHAKGKVKSGISLQLAGKSAKSAKAEGYLLTVNSKVVQVEGSDAAGVFYAVQTLRKSLPVLAKADAVELPAVIISDAPRFGYRGMHLDVARHFLPVEFVKTFIDMMVLHNMNRFHWHLTEDQGWRLPVEQYPRLIEVGSKRAGTVVGYDGEITDGIPQEGYYTDDDIRGIVRYAAERHIVIIPEIDIPGHTISVLASYPELGCTGGPYEVGQYWGVYRDILCAGNEQVYTFVNAVLDKVCKLFPSEYIHIGGDECPRDRWENCPKCQAMIAREGLKGDNKHSAEALLQGYFTRRVQHYLAGKGKKVIGWDELLECQVDTTATIMSWRGAEPGTIGADLGHDVIMTPAKYLYFNRYQTNEHRYEPWSTNSTATIDNVYSFEPVAPTLSETAKRHIVGVQGCLWGEYVKSANDAQYKVLPRMAALAEIQWLQPGQKNYDAFKGRLGELRHIYELYGWKYARNLWPDDFRREVKQN